MVPLQIRESHTNVSYVNVFCLWEEKNCLRKDKALALWPVLYINIVQGFSTLAETEAFQRQPYRKKVNSRIPLPCLNNSFKLHSLIL